LTMTEEIHVHAPLVGRPSPMKLELWPGRSWYRDLNDNNGQFRGQVQSVKRPTSLEISGPPLMSYPISNKFHYHLSEVEGGAS
jgi:hypothetical protein